MEFSPGFAISPDVDKMTFLYGGGTFGPEVERRRLDDIRRSLRDPRASGPSIPYVVAMDVGKLADRDDLISRHLLYGVMIYAGGRIGKEPIRSQGHVHSTSASCACSTPEVYEVWSGKAVIYMQERASDDPGRCFAVHAKAGQVVVVPPSWAHYTVNASPDEAMVFGAWCIRDYGFEYDDIRAHGGLAWFPLLEDAESSPVFVRDGALAWVPNEAYAKSELVLREARPLSEFGLQEGVPIYSQYERNHSLFNFVVRPQDFTEIWACFEP